MAFPTHEELEAMRARAHEDVRLQHIVANSVCLFAAAVALVLRILSRRLLCRPLGPDDWLIIVSMVLVSVHVGVVISSFAAYGMGRHLIVNTTPRMLAVTSVTAQVLYNVSILGVKLSILAFYFRLFPQTWFKKTIIGLGLFIALYAASQSIAQALQCIPFRALWDPETPGKCISLSALVITGGVVNITTDFAILLLPMPSLLKLNLGKDGKGKKVIMLSLFSMGIFVCVVSIVRLVNAKLDSHDPSWDIALTATLSSLELNIAIIAACMPTYRPLYNFLKNGTINNSYSGGEASKPFSAHISLKPTKAFGFKSPHHMDTIGGTFSGYSTPSPEPDEIRLVKPGNSDVESAPSEHGKRIMVTTTLETITSKRSSGSIGTARNEITATPV